MRYTFCCGLILVGITEFQNEAFASSLQRTHPLFGKCTANDLPGGPPGAETAFLEDSWSPPAKEECMKLLEDEYTLISDAVRSSNETEVHLTEKSTPDEIIAHAKELLNGRPDAVPAQRKAVIKKAWDLLAKGSDGSSMFVLGLGPELFVFSTLAKHVIAVEFDYEICQEFLKSKAGSCAMQPNVHIYCTHPDAESNSTAKSQTVLKAYKTLVEDLVTQQFGDVPISSLVVLGKYPVAKLVMMRKFLDQSTVIVSRSRMPVHGLAAIGALMRVLANVGSLSHSAETTLLMQLMFSPIQVDENLWMAYTVPEWAFEEEVAPLELVRSVRQAVKAAAAEAPAWKRDALEAYMDMYTQAVKRRGATDWEATRDSLEALKIIAASTKGADTLLSYSDGYGHKRAAVACSVFYHYQTEARTFANFHTQQAADFSGLHNYFKLTKDTLAKHEYKHEVLLHATICKLFTDATDLIASPKIMDKFKETVEDSCEVAEARPQLFLPALRLIQGGLLGEDFMGDAAQVVSGLKRLGADADIAGLTQYSEA